MDDLREKLTQRRDGHKEWLQDNAPFCFVDQKHLDENTPARAYWHYGYMVALTDVLNQMEKAKR
jgi:hypothetical protein